MSNRPSAMGGVESPGGVPEDNKNTEELREHPDGASIHDAVGGVGVAEDALRACEGDSTAADGPSVEDDPLPVAFMG